MSMPMPGGCRTQQPTMDDIAATAGPSRALSSLGLCRVHMQPHLFVRSTAGPCRAS
ncbi:MAG: hypothetical protein KAY11_15875 [Ilumatobacteraceae bacterium]|nr:hypothetical protein [Acidimicrobiaceae bacterium]MBP7890550.1 hypothetical protein [Ilumatobacteraceae bacterium]MBP8211047.1 hypothetical protein [Ilumatobacteraceae bacterium]MBP9051915.1 hypothetical protein [Ilumatobacteraceae bacterium]